MMRFRVCLSCVLAAIVAVTAALAGERVDRKAGTARPAHDETVASDTPQSTDSERAGFALRDNRGTQVGPDDPPRLPSLVEPPVCPCPPGTPPEVCVRCHVVGQ